MNNVSAVLAHFRKFGGTNESDILKAYREDRKAVTPTTFHIRRRLARRGGNQFYRDYSIRETSAFCGGAITSNDADWRSKAQPWMRGDEQFVACEKCLSVRAKENAKA